MSVKIRETAFAVLLLVTFSLRTDAEHPSVCVMGCDSSVVLCVVPNFMWQTS